MTRALRARLVALTAIALLVSGGCGDSGADATRATVGRPAPTFRTVGLDGEAVELADFRGEVVLLNFWASWCVPCRKEFPLLQDQHERDGVTVLAVVFNDRDDDARAFMADMAATFPALKDDGAIARAYQVGQRPGIPVTYAIDVDGVVRAKHLGEADAADLDELVDQAR